MGEVCRDGAEGRKRRREERSKRLEKDMETEEKAAGSRWEQRIINVRLIKSY